MIMCQSRPLEPRADRPRPRGGPSAVKRTDFTRDKQALWSKNELACGPSAPQGRTVRSSLFSPNQRNNLSGTNLRLACGPSSPQGRTVLRSTLKPTSEIPFLVQLLKQSCGPSAHLGRTVREPTRDFASSLERSRTVCPSCADCPPLLSQPSTLVASQS